MAGIWDHVVDDEVQISVFNKGQRYELAGIAADTFTDSEEAKQIDAGGADPTVGGRGGTPISWMDAPDHIGELVTKDESFESECSRTSRS
jgi:hypothetical protein